MEDAMHQVVLKRFEKPDEIRTFEKGKFELVHIGGMTIGRPLMNPVGGGLSTWGKAWVRKNAWF
jgi:hypothetical protein